MEIVCPMFESIRYMYILVFFQAAPVLIGHGLNARSSPDGMNDVTKTTPTRSSTRINVHIYVLVQLDGYVCI